MSRIITEKEFKKSMNPETTDEEFKKIVNHEIPVDVAEENPETKPRKKPGPKPGTKRKASKKTAPEAAGQKTFKDKAEEINSKTIIKAMEKAVKQEEAIKSAAKLTAAFAEYLTDEAKKRLSTAEKYTEYTEILEDMI